MNEWVDMCIVNHEGSSQLSLNVPRIAENLHMQIRSKAEVQIDTFGAHGGVKHAIQDLNQTAAEECATSASVNSLRFDYADVSLIAADLGPNC